MLENAIILANESYRTPYAKTAHGLVRGPSRYKVKGVVDSECAGGDAGLLLDGIQRDIPVHASVLACIESLAARPRWCVVGCAPPGGRFTASLRQEIVVAIQNGLSVVSGLHEFLQDDKAFTEAAQRHNVELLDIRLPAPRSHLRYWSGDILKSPVPRIAVLGTDCGLGKRTTCQILRSALIERGVRAELVYTGQTGWLQGGDFGFILDSTPNDFVSGELERAVLACAHAHKPDVILIEGQSALQNPSGPCGSELIVSCAVDGVILQHAPARIFFKGLEALKCAIPPLAKEISLIRMYGAEVWALALNTTELDAQSAADIQDNLAQELKIPVVNPLSDCGARLAQIVSRRYERSA